MNSPVRRPVIADAPCLALFDFDGTITFEDSFAPFLYRAVNPLRLRLGAVALSPMIAAYKFGWLPNTYIRAAVVRAGLSGRRHSEIQRHGEAYAREVLPHIIRDEARERLQWHRDRGHTVVVVSASLDAYLEPWCKQQHCELICTQLEVTASKIVTGRYVDGDCTGLEKARRVAQRFELSRYARIFAYGDTREDRDLLQLAHERVYRWQSISGLP